MNKATLYKRVANLREQSSLALLSYPLIITEAAQKILPVTIRILECSNPKLCAIACIGKKTDTIGLNSLRTKQQHNFDAAHEIMHLTMHRNLSYDSWQCFENLSYSTADAFTEWQANEGAAELLVPYELFLPMLKEGLPQVDKLYGGIYQFKKGLADYFGVPFATIELRFKSLNYEIHQYINGTPLHKIKFLSQAALQKEGLCVPIFNHSGNLRLKHGLSIDC